MKNLKTKILSTLSISALAFSMNAMAQQSQQQNQHQMQNNGQAAEELTEQQVNTFVDVLMDLQDVSKKYSDEIVQAQANENVNEIAKLQQQTQQEMQQVIEKSDMSLQEYNALSQQVNQDPELREMVLEKIESE